MRVVRTFRCAWCGRHKRIVKWLYMDYWESTRKLARLPNSHGPHAPPAAPKRPQVGLWARWLGVVRPGGLAARHTQVRGCARIACSRQPGEATMAQAAAKHALFGRHRRFTPSGRISLALIAPPTRL